MSEDTPLEEVKGKKPTKKKQTKKAKPEVVQVVEEKVEDTFLDRLIKEKTDLDDKIKGLYIFTRGPMKDVLPEAKLLLQEQLLAMQTYSTLLKKRLDLLK